MNVMIFGTQNRTNFMKLTMTVYEDKHIKYTTHMNVNFVKLVVFHYFDTLRMHGLKHKSIPVLVSRALCRFVSQFLNPAWYQFNKIDHHGENCTPDCTTHKMQNNNQY
jgi:hypothetical protein